MGRSQEELLRQAASGDGLALTDLLEEHTSAVRKGLAGKIPRRWQSVLSVDDVLQQTYIDAFLSIDRFDPTGEASFPTWLTSIAKYNLLDALRMFEADKRGANRDRVQFSSSEDSFVSLYGLLVSSDTTPSQGVARKEARIAVEQAIAQLPEVYRRVVQMYDLDGLSVHEVARVLDRTPGAIYMIRARAHRKLCEAMGRPSQYLTAE